VLLKSSFVVVFNYDDVEISLFKGGRMLIKNVKNEKKALEVYKNVMKHLEADEA
jgi:ArsR family metal-binding transcriptional regulator